MGVGSSDILPWLIPLTLGVFLSYSIIFSESIVPEENTFEEYADAFYELSTFSQLPFPINFILLMVIVLPWGYVVFDLINEGIPG